MVKEFVIWVLIVFFALAIPLVILMYLQSKKGFLKKEKERKASQNDPLWDLKKEILKVLTRGPISFSHLCVTMNNPCDEEVLIALNEMEKAGVVGKREIFNDNPDFQIWEIARFDFFELWAKLRKVFSKRGKE